MSTITKEQRDERLKTLYMIMGGIPAERIDMDLWRGVVLGARAYKHNNYDNVSDKRLLTGGCGTVACALGWAASYPEFQELGLRYDARKDDPVCHGKRGFRAAEEFFGLDAWKAEELFGATLDSNGQADKRTFLRRLRNLLVELNVTTRARSDELAKEEVAREEQLPK